MDRVDKKSEGDKMAGRNGMEVKCSIIQDLLPSYVDGICSEDTGELVQAHIGGCENCKGKLEQMRSVGLVSDKMQKQEVDYLKKFKKNMVQMERLGSILLCLMVLAEVWFAVRRRAGTIQLDRGAFVFLTLMLVIAAGMAGNFKVNVRKGRMAAELALSVGTLLCLLGMGEYLIYCISHEKVLFPHVELNQVGPILFAFCLTIMAVEGVMLLWHTFGTYKNAYATLINSVGLNLAGIFVGILYSMDDKQSVIRAVHSGELVELGILVAGMLIFAGYRKLTPLMKARNR